MTLPSDNQQANDHAKVDGSTQPEYEMLGQFKPRDAKRIVERLEKEHISFKVEDCSQHGLYDIWPWRRRWLCIYVRAEHKEKAQAISDQDSARSRAAAGICYIAVGGIICTTALLLMRSGVRSIPYHYRSGGDGPPIPLEMVGGIAGIVAFIGLLQLLIAFILKLRGRQ